MSDTDLVKRIADLERTVSRLQARDVSSPTWTTYAATASGSSGSAGTYAEDNVSARYYTFGKTCHVIVCKRITNKGSWSGNFQVAVPIAIANSVPGIGMAGEIIAQASLAAKAKTIILSGGLPFLFYTLWNAAVTQWADIAVNDWVFIRCEYEIA